MLAVRSVARRNKLSQTRSVDGPAVLVPEDGDDLFEAQTRLQLADLTNGIVDLCGRWDVILRGFRHDVIRKCIW